MTPNTLRSFGRFIAISLLVVAADLSAPAEAQQVPDRTFSPQLFHPAVGPDEFFTIQPAMPLPHLNFSGGLWINYSRNPLTIFKVDANGVGQPLARVIANQLSADLVVALGLWDRLQIGLGVPMTIFQNGDDYNYVDNGVPGQVKAPTAFALGDPWIDIKVRLYGKDRGINLSLAPFLSIPASLATANNFGGDGNVNFGANALAGWEAERWRVGAKLGVVLRAACFSTCPKIFSTTVGHNLVYGAAFAYDVLPQRRIAVLAELYGRTDISGGVSNVDASPLELDLGAKVRLARAVYLNVGGGFGLVKGIGSPQVRALAGVTFAPDTRDRDKDGISDLDDKCPADKEDKDGFRDDDGCPDPDNDGDQFKDPVDKCPLEAEDYDQFQDDDGCPEPDNDSDGILDIKDACPADKEDGKPPKADDGCPLDRTDTDEDGVPDSRDKCPLDPEDKDNFADDDGCPDPDNDNDGLPDQYDKCPNDAEDMDSFEDDDGCSEPDNDRDGVLDRDDKCPKEPETINGFKDEDGCPDTGPAAKVQVVGEEIVILDKVFFDTDKATIKPISFGLLDQVALTIKAHPELLKIKIEGHTDNAGSADHNKKLSQARAESVKDYLAKKGVEPGRLDPVGLGSERPVADNKTAKGKEANRRVEFHITERQKPKAEEAPQQ